MISYNSLKIFFPPILWNLLSRYYRYFKNNKKKYDIRRWWSGEAISANGETFKNYQFLESDQKYITIYLEKEAKETILIKKKKSLKIKFQFKNKIQPYKVLFTFGNINDQVIEGKIDIKSDDITIISLKNLRPKAWNRVRSFFKNEEILEIINCTNRDIYFTAPTVIYKYENKKDLTKDIIFIALDQVDLALFKRLEEKNLLPNISNFFSRNSISYEKCFCPGDWTVPCFNSIFSGLYPSSHGFYDLKYSSSIKNILDKDDNLISHLKKLKFNTMGIIKSKGHNPAYNVEKIFDRFLFFEDIPGKTDNDDDLFVDLTIDYLEANKNSKNFVFLHYMKSHSPYYLPSYFEETELDKDRNLDPGKEFYDAQIGYQDTKIAVNLKGDIFENKIRLRQEVRLRKIDMLLGNIFNYLEKNNLANSMVILTADHGIPHGEKNRSFLDNNWINIPLKIKYPSSSINLNSINTNPVSPVEFYDLLFKNMKHEQKNGKFFENDLKSNFVFSESIFNEVYKVVISSRFFQFRFACSFDPLRKVVFINKIIFSSYSENGKDIQIESNKYYYFLKKIKENLIKSKILSVN